MKQKLPECIICANCMHSQRWMSCPPEPDMFLCMLNPPMGNDKGNLSLSHTLPHFRCSKFQLFDGKDVYGIKILLEYPELQSKVGNNHE